jgi:hypothetical protein
MARALRAEVRRAQQVLTARRRRSTWHPILEIYQRSSAPPSLGAMEKLCGEELKGVIVPG